VNSGGVIYAAQEHLIKTPSKLRIPDELLGKRAEVEEWLKKHSNGLSKLADERKAAAEVYCEEVIQRNMREVVDLLVSDSDMLPCEAAETISIRRITASETHRTAKDVMAPIPTVTTNTDLRDAAKQMITSGSHLLAVVSEGSEIVGVITEWDIANAVANGAADTEALETTMTKDVITVRPDTSLLEVLRTLEHYEISAMPVVDEAGVHGIVSSDLLATRSLLRLLQSQVDD
jgi:glutamate dehydrogenase (NAD(P)+)